MAKQTKSITCRPEKESDMIEFWQKFGWELFSTQEVHDSESHTEQSVLDYIGGMTTSVTTTTHYVKITFQRDPAKVKNYQKLHELEMEFENTNYPPEPELPSKIWIYIGFYFFIIPGIILKARYNRIKKERIPEWRKACEEVDKKLEEIVAKAELLSSESELLPSE